MFISILTSGNADDFFVIRINQSLYAVSHKIFTVLKEVYLYNDKNIICSTFAERVVILQSGIIYYLSKDTKTIIVGSKLRKINVPNGVFNQ